ncbi:helix-turn-helix transcriptional regulator [Paenibacillus chitinolyticus]|uniref:helix-turn-helix transcriptional regulator n=1 Tax=Paenibacillus chitinolyticus TaxID=79263 RepID=UPI00366931A5
MKNVCYDCDSLHISRKELAYTSMPSRHTHDAFEMMYLVSGQLYYFIGDKTYQVVGGVLLFINANVPHQLVNAGEAVFERVTLLFKEEFLHDFFRLQDGGELLSFFSADFHAVHLSGYEQTFAEELFHKMLHEGVRKQIGFEKYQKVLLMELLLFMNRKVREADREQSGSGASPTHKKIYALVEYINNRFYERLTLEDLSHTFEISPSHLSRTFKEVTGYTAIEYINNVRIKKACALLRETSWKVLEICERVGFDSLTHFGRTFKQMTGCSPGRYRRRQP